MEWDTNGMVHNKYGYFCNKSHAEKGAEYRRNQIAKETARKKAKLQKKLRKLR